MNENTKYNFMRGPYSVDMVGTRDDNISGYGTIDDNVSDGISVSIM